MSIDNSPKTTPDHVNNLDVIHDRKTMMLNDVVDSSDTVNHTVDESINENAVEDATVYKFEDIPIIPKTQDRSHVEASIPVLTLKRFYQYSMDESNGLVNWDDHLTGLINEYNLKFDKLRYSASLIFDGRKPRRDVLLKLDDIATELELEPSFPSVHRARIPLIIKQVFSNPDDRTLKKYVKCLNDYVKSVNNNLPSGLYFNFQNFKETVRSELDL